MTVFDPISGKHVLIDLSEKPRNARGVGGFDERFLPGRQESSVALQTGAACRGQHSAKAEPRKLMF
jgi:hypothetical protein